MKKLALQLLQPLSLFVIALSFIGNAWAAGDSKFVLYSFTSGKDGSNPASTLVADKLGNLYGTTQSGGANSACSSGCGTVFKLVAPTSRAGDWTEKILYRFTGGNDGGYPEAGIIFDQTGNLYGTTNAGGNTACDGGCGVVFELSPPTAPGTTWTEQTLYSFSGPDGGYSEARLTFDHSGNLYGTTFGGGLGTTCATGTLVGCGVVFELMAPSTQGEAWTYALLYSFPQYSSDGVLPRGDLIFDQSGNLYGTTQVGGATNGIGGIVFELSPPRGSGGAWTESQLYSFFGANGNSGPATGVTFDTTGNLFGTTYGYVFELMPSGGGSWTENTLLSGAGHTLGFAGDLIFDHSGNLYGTASGALFQLQAGTWAKREIDLFTGGGPLEVRSGLALGKWGAIYGTSFEGGISKNCGRNGCGTVFGVTP